jgi:hypothetical protein
MKDKCENERKNRKLIENVTKVKWKKIMFKSINILS